MSRAGRNGTAITNSDMAVKTSGSETTVQPTVGTGNGGLSASGTALPGEGIVVVSEAGTGLFTQTIQAGRHRLTADEPSSQLPASVLGGQ